ncbi:conserved hypothetical protein [Leishmania braziliensis MHOM/BR/75/M2904]|uniref:EF-hand domain-containing protein n=2 Tax=Leishmania braziliensis TaxID=5660 RepID=A4H333_LEIBR|nr:conserved hypothetical protein [Leishmania braziliensis MHOM/BR/75/M2904]CAJ2465652.1 unnamed protein product [Leishmania braziliensis]CAM36430.1 conserved hypothetical protein [Leishmania braziliensis MHOM/BR/75/M2904]SYZ62358.1 hypothetical_protein [Leishmania braziliensis MHOM/BR/75/M2904]
MASVAPADPRSGAAAAGVGIATTTTLTSPAKLNSVVFVPKTGSALAHGTATNYGFHDAPTTTTISNGGGTGAITNEQSKMLARVLTKLPDLDLGEMSRVKSCFSAVLGEGRENVVNGLELRLVLGELGLYPSEAELNLILRAYRGRVNLVTLTQYLRLYKKEFWINRTAAAAAAAAVAGGADAKQMPSQSIALHSYKPFSGSQPMAAARAGAFGVCGDGDEDTLKAFVALGGGEDGGGEIPASTLRDAIRGFGLTVDIDSMIRTVDVHHSGMLDYVDFCILWSQPASTTSEPGDAGSVGLSAGEALLRESADDTGPSADRRRSSFTSVMSDTHRRLLSFLVSTPRRSSLAAGALRRRSQMLTQLHEQSSLSPRAHCGSLGGTRFPQSTKSRGTTAAHGRWASGVGNGHGAGDATACHPVAAPPPMPITDEEHMLLVEMHLFPEQYDTTARRVLHFAAAPGAARAGSVTGGEAMPYPGAFYQKHLSRLATSAARSRSCSRSRSRRPARGHGGGGGAADGGNTLATDFFSPKNNNVYLPPSPMILSMRNSTAHRNRLKRLEEQKRAGQGRSPAGAAATQQQRKQHLQRSLASAAPRCGDDGVGDLESQTPTPLPKSSTW